MRPDLPRQRPNSPHELLLAHLLHDRAQLDLLVRVVAVRVVELEVGHVLENRFTRHTVGLDRDQLDAGDRVFLVGEGEHHEQLQQAPQTLKVRLAAYHEQLVAGRDVDAQDLEAVGDVLLVNAHLVEPERGSPFVLGPELFLDSFDDIELCARVVVPGVGEEVVDLGLLLVEWSDCGEGGLGRLAVFVVAGW